MLRGSAKKIEYQDNPTLEACLTVGNLLKNAREAQGFSVQDVATSLHIRRLYLETIESGDFNTLPGQVYAIGFIRSYAKFLNLDSDELLRQLEFSQPIIKPHAFSARPLVEKKSPRLLAWGFLGLFFIILLGLYLVITHQDQTLESHENSPQMLDILPETPSPRTS